MDNKWAPCLARDGFNYNSSIGGPCIFLKLNKIYGWKPEYYNNTGLPPNMPPHLKDQLQNMNYGPNEYAVGNFILNYILSWVRNDFECVC